MSVPLNRFSTRAEASSIALLAALADEARARDETILATQLVGQIYAELDARLAAASR